MVGQGEEGGKRFWLCHPNQQSVLPLRDSKVLQQRINSMINKEGPFLKRKIHPSKSHIHVIKENKYSNTIYQDSRAIEGRVSKKEGIH